MNAHNNQAESIIKPELVTLLDWLNYMQNIHVSAIDMGLSRVLPVAKQLSLITSAKQSEVFTVAGTNGKGSTTAVIAEICHQAGYKTALYQSPHLIEFNERIQINGIPVADDRLIQAFRRVEQARLDCQLSLSFFEMTTLAAMLIFAESNCDVWVLEVGLGGRLDVVNIIDPDITVITNIGIDHVDWLGTDRESIGYEKAGILRAGVPLIFGDLDMPNSIAERIQSLDVPCYQRHQHFDYVEDDNDNNHAHWQYSNASVTMHLPKPQLSLINTANAISAVLTSQLSIHDKHIRQAMFNVKLAGRFDYRKIKDRRWLFDVGHNEAGMTFLLSQLTAQLNQLLPIIREADSRQSDNNNQSHQSTAATASRQGKIYLLFSMLKDKEIETVVQLLSDGGLPIGGWYIAPIDPTYNPRSADTQQLLASVSQYVDSDKLFTCDNLALATQSVKAATTEADLILVCGSFHTISEVMTSLVTELS